MLGPSFWGNWPSHTILWLNSNLGKIPRKSNRPDNWVGTHGPMESIRGGVIKRCLGRSLHHVGLITELIAEKALSDRGTIKYLAPDKNQKPGKILLSTGCFLFQWQISQSRSSLRLSWALQIIRICLLEPIHGQGGPWLYPILNAENVKYFENYDELGPVRGDHILTCPW